MPFFSLNTLTPGIQIGLWKIEEKEDFFLDRLKLYENEIQRLSKISHPMSRLEWLSSRLCLKELLKINHQVESLNRENGSPYLSDNSYLISYTHSTKYSAAIASQNRNVSIDLEYLKRTRNMKTRYLFMNDNELAAFDRANDDIMFYLIWSAKETLYKVYGKRGIAFKHDLAIDTKKFSGKPNGSISGTVKENGLYKEYEIFYHIYPEFILTFTSDLVWEPEVQSAC